MNKSINIFKHYSVDEILKAVTMFCLFGLIPIASIVITTVNVILLMIPSYYVVIAIMIGCLELVVAFATYVFITTLRNLNNVMELEYKKLYHTLFLSLSFIVIVTSLIVSISLK